MIWTRAPRDDQKRRPVPSRPAVFLFESPVPSRLSRVVSRPVPSRILGSYVPSRRSRPASCYHVNKIFLSQSTVVKFEGFIRPYTIQLSKLFCHSSIFQWHSYENILVTENFLSLQKISSFSSLTFPSSRKLVQKYLNFLRAR